MPGVRWLVALAFSASVGITLLILGCALPQFNNFWPMFCLIFYALCGVPLMISGSCVDSYDTPGARLIRDVCLFLTVGIIVSAYGLPLLLAHTPLGAPVIQWGACGLVMAGNTVVFLTIFGFLRLYSRDEDDFSRMW